MLKQKLNFKVFFFFSNKLLLLQLPAIPFSSIQNKSTLYQVIHYQNSNYSVFSIDSINTKLIVRGLVAINLNYKQKSGFMLKSISPLVEFVDALLYLSVAKFKIVGRVFRVKKRSNRFLLGLLNYSHNIYMFTCTSLTFLKLRFKKGRLLICSYFSFFKKKLIFLINLGLRSRNIYTRKGVCSKVTKVWVRKRGIGSAKR